jgi:serine/threonine protein kinase
MNPNYQEFKFPQIRANPWASIFKPGTSAEAMDLVGKMLSYIPYRRTRAIEACIHPFFDDLRAPDAKTHAGTAVCDDNFQFTPEELTGVNAELLEKLCPSHITQPQNPSNIAISSISEDGGSLASPIAATATATSSTTNVVVAKVHGEDGDSGVPANPYSSLATAGAPAPVSSSSAAEVNEAVAAAATGAAK